MRQINDGSPAGMMNPIVIMSTPCDVCDTPAGEVCRRECGCGDRLDTFINEGSFEDRLAMHLYTEQAMQERHPDYYEPGQSLTLSPRELDMIKKDKRLQAPEKITFFWQKDSPFSQWYPCTFTIKKKRYNCTEQWMMAEKARMFGDTEREALIMKARDPDIQKRLGRQVRKFNEGRWNARARDIVYEGNLAKFSQNPELKDLLLETAGTTLAEASPYDKIWGIGLQETDRRAKSRNTWNGTNWLGEVLMRVRATLMSEG